jgi:selenocysteine lyase/cysteine desulfurase
LTEAAPACRRDCFAALRGDSLRLAPHLHNTPDEVERLLGALGAIAGD